MSKTNLSKEQIELVILTASKIAKLERLIDDMKTLDCSNPDDILKMEQLTNHADQLVIDIREAQLKL